MATSMNAASDVTETKATARQQLQIRRDALSSAERQRLSDAITDTLLAEAAYLAAGVVMAYMTFGSEFITGRFISHTLAQGKTLVLPRIRRADGTLELYRVADVNRDLVAGPWGILEPNPDNCEGCAIGEVDFVLVPGLGFDAQGRRLGYGRAFYDRLLVSRAARTVLAAAAFSVQLVERIAVEAHDVPVDLVITEAATHRRIPR